MPPLVVTLVTSLAMGMRHATDPDHVVAVTAIASRERSLLRACTVGAAWGLGHTATLLAVGTGIVALRWTIAPRAGLWLELLVAAMLITLGVVNLRSAGHAQGGEQPAVRAGVRPMVVGGVHGLAGSAGATLMVLPLVRDPRWAAVHLAVFGFGTVVGMTLATTAVAAPSLWMVARADGMARWIRTFAGVASLLFGLYYGWRIGWVDGLFTGSPR
ncbi:MAG: high-affinity nickel-transport family protein [Armatimonadota bacterium]